MPDAFFVLVGGGALRGDLEALSRALGIGERVIFTGAREDTRALLSAFDLLVSPSRSEGMSNVILEAMSMARPILATSVGGTRELLRQDATGVLVPPRDPAALAKGMLSLLSDRARANALGASARKEAEERFSSKEMVHRYVGLYDELLGARSSSTSS
jgi:glycosyltransferase involved in cell wall biosynthesis